MIASVNPFTEQTVEKFDTISTEEAIEEVKASDRTQTKWFDVPVTQRAKKLVTLSENLQNNMEKYARLISEENGKPIKDSRSEVKKCSWCCSYYAENAERFLKATMVKTEHKKSYIRYDPLGVVFGILPSNDPFWMAIRFAAPALTAGNTVVIKHASNVPRSVREIQKLFIDSGFERDNCKVILANSETAMKIIETDLVDAVHMTGGLDAGSEVAQLAGKRIIKTVLELGGSDPFIVLGDADIQKAAEIAVKARMEASGQNCIAAKRVIVTKSVLDEFKEALKKNLNHLKVGDPLEDDTDVGPLAKPESAEEIRQKLKDAESKGGEIVYGPKPPDNGYFVRPAFVFGSGKDMEIVSEEVFGPVAPVIVVNDEEEAIQVANSSKYGLGASVWTRDIKKGERISAMLEAGMVFINGATRSDPRLPMGGVKNSGIGRELAGFGFDEYTNKKTVVVTQ